jgi:inosine-uridine nucleoside N-ribohydrolase
VTAIPVIIDCDPGHDDAIALMLAAASPELELIGVTTVAGNTTVDKTTRNALAVLELVGRSDIPVATGSEAPLRRDLVTAEHIHGSTGLDGPRISEPAAQPHRLGAVPFLAEALAASDRPVTLIPVGPLTNIAMLLTGHPELHDRIDRIVLMGGSMGLGNVTPAAEFNIYVDPEAASIVFGSGLDVEMVGLDVTHEARLDSRHADFLRGSGHAGTFVAALLDFFIPKYQARMGFDGAPIHDALAVASVIDPEVLTSERVSVEVDTSSGPSVGRTLVDRYRVTGNPANAAVGVGVNPDRFAKLLIDRIAALG